MRCCPSPELTRSYVPFWPFGRSVYCERCGEVTSDMTRLGEWVFENVVLLFWVGRVTVHENESVESD